MTGQLQISDGRTVAVRDGLTLGRVAGCDIVIDDTKASRRHARIVAQDGVVEVEDLGSSNGTMLNGKPVQRRVLRDGDEIQIGATRIVYREQAMAQKPAAKSDDLDLFGDDEPASDEAVAGADELDFEAPKAAAAPAPSPAPAPSKPAAPPSPPRATVEFADEVVEVRKPAATPQRGAATAAAASGEPQLAQKQRVLQFSQNKSSAPLGDDLSQMSSGKRSLIVIAVLLSAGALAWALMTMVS